MGGQRKGEPKADGFRYGFEEIGRILDIVRDAGGTVSADFYPLAQSDFRSDRFAVARERRTALGQAISWAFKCRDVHADWWSDERAIQKYARLGEIGELAQKLHALLEKDDGQSRSALSPYFPMLGKGVTLYDVVDGIGALPEAAKREKRRLKDAGLHEMAPLNQTPVPDGRNRHDPGTAGGSFIVELGEVFREFFGEPKIMTNDDGEPEGPFIAFVQALRSAANASVTASAVKQAWIRARRRSGDNPPEN